MKGIHVDYVNNFGDGRVLTDEASAVRAIRKGESREAGPSEKETKKVSE